MIELVHAFDLQAKAIVSIVGGGGKTTLLFALAKALPGRVVVTTTTRIFAAQMKLAPAVVTFQHGNAAKFDQLVGEALAQHGRLLITGAVIGDKAHGVPPDLPAQLLARADVDFVVVEADGSRMRPIKAPAAHEPVIPPESTHVIPVIGIDALDKPIVDVAHRPELVVRILERELLSVSRELLSAEDVARLILHPNGGMKGVPDGAQVIPLINKVETAVQRQSAHQIAASIFTTDNGQRPTKISRVVIGAMQQEQPICVVQRKVTAVILAAGQAKRMGHTKQLLPWGDTTVLGQTIRNVKETAVHDIVVVTGHQATDVEAIAQAEGVKAIHNPQFAQGEMLSSLQTAVRHLPPNVEAVLVVLADQPMVKAGVMDKLLTAFWQMSGELIAPTFNGKRGNPVLIGRPFFAELLALPPTAAPRTLLKRHQGALHMVPVATDSILRDLDEWEGYVGERP